MELSFPNIDYYTIIVPLMYAICQERSNYIIGGTLPRRLSFEGTAVFLENHDSLVAAWLSLTGALHGCVYDGTIQEKDTRR